MRYVVAKAFGSVCQVLRIFPVSEVYYSDDENPLLFRPCPVENVKVNGDLTYRIKRRNEDGKILYSRVLILAVTETIKEARHFLSNKGVSGRGARIKIPKSSIYTPNNVRSCKKAVKQRMAVAKEKREINGKRKKKVMNLAKSNKSMQALIASKMKSNVDVISSSFTELQVTEVRAHASPLRVRNETEPASFVTHETKSAIPRIIHDEILSGPTCNAVTRYKHEHAIIAINRVISPSSTTVPSVPIPENVRHCMISTPPLLQSYIPTPRRTKSNIEPKTLAAQRIIEIESSSSRVSSVTSTESVHINNVQAVRNDDKSNMFIGIKNQGATCYISSLLQSLYFTTPMRNAILKMQPHDEEPTRSVAAALHSIFSALQSGDKLVTTQELTDSFAREGFDFRKQQDVQEFLRLLFEELENNMKGTCDEDAIQKFFGGNMKTIVTNKNIITSEVVEIFYDIQLNVVGKKNIYESFDDYVSTESLSDNDTVGTEEGIEFEESQSKKKRVTFLLFPPVLHVHLIRFKYNAQASRSEKCNDRFEFYTKIQLSRYREVADSDCTDDDYTLHSVLVHSGNENAGHYVVFIDPHCDGKWYKFNDEEVRACTPKEAIDDNYGGDDQREDGQPSSTVHNSTNAYMLVYIRNSELRNVQELQQQDKTLDNVRIISTVGTMNHTDSNEANPGMNTENVNSNSIMLDEEEVETVQEHADSTSGTLSDNNAPNELNVMYGFRDEVQESGGSGLDSGMASGSTASVNSALYEESDLSIVERNKTPHENKSTVIHNGAQENPLKFLSVETDTVPVPKPTEKRVRKKDTQKSDLPLKNILKKMEKRLMMAIKSNSPGEACCNDRTDDVLEMPSNCDSDGMITIIDDIRLKYEAYVQAADAPTMRKRVYALIEGMWSLEERLQLTVDRKKRNSYNRVSTKDLKKIKNVCLYLQKHNKLNNAGPNAVCLHLREWISMKIKTDRYRNKKRNRKRSKKTQPSSDSSSVDVGEPKRKKNTWRSRRAVIFSENEGTDNDNGMDTNDKTIENNKPRQIADLLALLSSSEYTQEPISPLLYSWDDLLMEMKWTDHDLREVMTPDSYVIVDGKCRTVDINFENEVLSQILEIAKTRGFLARDIIKVEIMKEANLRYRNEIIDYIFNKYLIQNNDRYRCDEEKIWKLRAYCYLQQREEWNYYELMGRLRSLPYCETMEKSDKQLFELHLKTYTEETSNMFIVPRKDGGILDFDGKKIMTENYARRQSHSM